MLACRRALWIRTLCQLQQQTSFMHQSQNTETASELPTNMASPKRSLSLDGSEAPDPKRVKQASSETSTPLDIIGSVSTATGQFWVPTDAVDEVLTESALPTQHFQARTGLQRSIAMMLKHDGFDTTSPQVMESFTNLAELYLDSFIKNLKTAALQARREQPTPLDYERTLQNYHIPVCSLKRHQRRSFPRGQLQPDFTDALPVDPDAFTTLPLLGSELSGKNDKMTKPYIPQSFPDFPSRHTYSFTPQEDINIRDPKKTREEAARTAQHGEDALRRLVRASKMRKQKEVKTLVEKDPEGKERFRLWEQTMRRFMVTDSRADNVDQVEFADYSMIVNSDSRFSRKENQRLHKRLAPKT